MGNIESGPEGSLGAVDSLKHRLQSLEETIRSIEVAHQDAQGDHFPAPGAADMCLYGARLVCTPGVQVLTGPIIGEVTENSAVVLLEVDIAPELGPTSPVTCHVSVSEGACRGGRVVHSTTLTLPSRRPRAFRIGGGGSSVIGPGRAFTVCFGGVSAEDARFRVGRFRTPGTCFEPRLGAIAVSGDRPDRLAPGEPSLWRVLRERVAVPSIVPGNVPGASGEGKEGHRHYYPIDVVLHAGGQAWMADAFEDAWELLRRRAMEPVLCADGGWREAQEEAEECLREAIRRSWNLPDKRAVLSSVSNLMVCGAADLHPDFEGHLARVSSKSVDGVNAGTGSTRRGKRLARDSGKERHEIRALHAAVRACRHVFSEYQGQLLWKALSKGGGGGGGDMEDLGAAFEAEEKGVEEALAETRRVERDEAVQQKKVAMAEEALRRAKAAGSLPTEGGLRAAEERIDKIRKQAKAARAARIALAKREVPAVAAAAVTRASQGGFLNLGGSIGLVLLDTVWSRVTWDGRIHQAGENSPHGVAGGSDKVAAPEAPPLLSAGAWEALELELGRDSELRLLIVVVRHALAGGTPHTAARFPSASSGNDQVSGTAKADGSGRSNLDGNPPSRSTSASISASDVTDDTGSGGRDERDRLFERLFAWKAGEAWREVVLVCGAAEGRGGRGGLRSACELEVLDSKHPGCTIRQVVAGPITDTPGAPPRATPATPDPTTGRRGSRAPSEATSVGGGRFSYRWSHPGPASSGSAAGDGDDDDDDSEPKGTALSSSSSSSSSDKANAIAAGPFGDDDSAITTAPEAGSARPSSRQNRLDGEGPVLPQAKAVAAAAPGWDDGAGGASGTPDSRHSEGSRPGTGADAAGTAPRQSTTMTTTADGRERRSAAAPVSAHGERSFIEAFLDGGHSPATAVAAGMDPAASARGVAASVTARAVTVTFVGAAVVLGPVVGRVTQRSAVVLVEVGSTAAVGCVLTDGATGWQHKQVRLLYPRQPHAFFFDTLEESRHYSIFLEGVDNGDARTGAFTTLKAWPDRREPPALRAVARLSGNGGDDDDHEQSQSCDVRLLFVSGTGLANAARVELRDEGDGGASTATAGEATAADMWGVLGRELWRPWPQADVVVHTGSQVDLEVAVMEALPILSIAEAEEEGSEEREQAEEMAMERIRDAYRFQWSLPGARACLSCGSHLMVRGEADLALPQLDGSSRRSSSSTTSSAAGGVGVSAGRGRRSGGGGGGETLAAGKGGGQGGGLLGLQVSAYARIALARLASQAFDDYQRQLWDPLSVPMGLDMNDVGYARGGPGIDSEGSGDGFFRNAASVGGEGEWHFHVYGETVGLFALDVRQGSAGLQRDERAPLLSDTQWSSLARALSIEEIQAMVVVGDAPFVSDSILDARAKARHPSHAHLRRSWPFHGGELLRLVGMLVEWKTAGAVGGEP
ncbi:unnamed protein product, partial [Ectocarpus sp. 12 AP-2014]